VASGSSGPSPQGECDHDLADALASLRIGVLEVSEEPQMDPRVVVARDWLIDELWGEDPPKTAAGELS
jgi:hypothetical protein